MEKTIIPEFTLIEDNNEQFTRIDIVGKTISDIIVLGGVAEKESLRVDGYLLICFTDGNILGLSAYDDTFYATYNYMTDTVEFREETANRSLTGPLAGQTVGKKTIDSTFNGHALHGSPMTLSMKLENGINILFEPSFHEDVLNVRMEHK